MLGNITQIAIDLHVPESIIGLLCQPFNLVQMTTAAAAAIDFLQADKIMPGGQLGDALQIVEYLLAGQHMAPAARNVFVIAFGADADLHVETQQRKRLAMRCGVGNCTGHVHSLPLAQIGARADVATQGIVPPMQPSPVIRNLLLRVLFLVVVACVAVVLVMAGWRVFLHRVGGYFPYAPEDAAWVLSDRAQALVTAAFADVGDAPVLDYQVGVIAMDGLADTVTGKTNYYRRDRASQAGPLAWAGTRLRLAAAGVDDVDAVDGRYVSRLLRQMRAMPSVYRAHVLARGWRYDDNGQRDDAGTYTHISNAYVWWLAQQAPDVLVPVVSIHPYRPHALQRLAHWAKKGVRSVAWWPLRQHIDPNDGRARAFYTVMAKHDMTLQLPVGAVDMVYPPGRGWIDPALLRLPLAAGVHVIASVQAATGERSGTQVVAALLRLRRYRNADNLQLTLSGALADPASNGVLMALLQHPQLYSWLRYASNYPLSALDANIDLEKLAEQGFIAADAVAPLREIHRVNPLLFVYVLARNLRLPQTALRLPVAVFVADKPAAPDAGDKTGSNGARDSG